jgi:type IV pilus assembly protein PilM
MFEKTSVGLDIADSSIEVVELTKQAGKISIKSKGRVLIESGIVERGRIKNKAKLAIAVKKVLSTAKPHPITETDIIFGLPEVLTFTKVIPIAGGAKGSKDKNILEEVYKAIPIDKEDAVISHKKRKSPLGGEEIVVLALSRDVLLEWKSFFKGTGLEVESFDSETLALRRGIFGGVPKKAVAIVDIGAYSTNISIFSGGGFRHSHIVPIAGEAITDEVANALSLSHDEAEKIKRTEGIKEPGSKCSNAICKVLSPIVSEVKNTIKFFNARSKDKIQAVVLAGGSSNIFGIADYFSENLEIPVKIGKMFAKSINDKESFLYIGASGLALRGIDESWNTHDPIIKSDAFSMAESSKNKQKKLASFRSNAENNKVFLYLRSFPKKVLILGLILIVGLFLLLGALIYRGLGRIALSQERARLSSELDITLEQLTNSTSTEDTLAGTTNVKNATSTLNISPKDKSSTSDEESVGESSLEKVLIKDTELGYLNVRSGPGTSFSIVTTVTPGEEYVVLEMQAGWYKLDLMDSEGWVSTRYVDTLQ